MFCLPEEVVETHKIVVSTVLKPGVPILITSFFHKSVHGWAYFKSEYPIVLNIKNLLSQSILFDYERLM